MMYLRQTAAKFKGRLLTEPEDFVAKLHGIKAYVWDWDGVFNNGFKNEGSSPFSEIDSMGTNLLRFHHYLRNADTVPVSAIISGESNSAAHTFAGREHFHALYLGAKDKRIALEHLCKSQGITPAQILFFFDDVLDFPVASQAGARIMVGRSCNPLMNDFAERNGWVDYITSVDGGAGAIREGVELITGLCGRYDEVMNHRIQFSETYQQYLAQREEVTTAFYKIKEGKVHAE